MIENFINYPNKYLTDNSGVSRAFHEFGVNLRYLGEVYKH